ncbi:endonuclease [Lacrimispora amygdalina]|uniref:Endonuclease n=1 Tax=Lacrimispora amygdalina TaxID=253257 RepID=A0A3E2N4V6_9FIRM|nr:Z1 domain-containing protein [Clostridium indicum]RFZ76004.1 endonuclease [Clostridium indicum]
MSNYGLPEYDQHRGWIMNARTRNMSWDLIMFAARGDDVGLKDFLMQQTKLNFWKEIDCVDWKALVQLQKDAEEQTKEIDYLSGQAMIMEEGEDNDVSIPGDTQSAWQLYRKSLIQNGFKDEVVGEMERATLKILKRLSNDTTTMLPVKGLVIGNVQSGKTANMAALMAMAADWGWNMFIVLSGTIENLRQQTQTRLFQDLNQGGSNLHWRPLEHLSKQTDISQRVQSLHFEESSKQRYFTVCLKNPGRLKKLIQWLQSDANKQKQMKILVIDDEADQAGINTADVNSATIRTINRLIRDLVNGRNEKSQEISNKYKAMNYIGYTATPYANILNEAGTDSLYPRSFISTLSVSKEYFGPQQIFGLEGGETTFEGLDIVRIISDEDLQAIKFIHEEGSPYVPLALQHSICWFLCGVSCMRIWGYKKPISMLIHTSQKTDHHQNISEAVKDWITSKDPIFLVEKCKEIWEYETKVFTFNKFREQYPQYDRKDDEIKKYPDFSEIKEQLAILLSKDISNIPLDEENELNYHEGLHLCVDNCKNNGVNDEGMHVRLAYPSSANMPSPAPAFIIVGGATLSRGLTIEGLISTFFLRSVSQADTLMQMGRWFGYRKGYELLPRLWITSKTNDQFKFLATLDQELRDEIHEMDTLGKSPAVYGPKVKNSPKLSFIRITAKNRMQTAQSTDMDFSGSFNQTHKFDNDREILLHNINVANEFISELGNSESIKPCNDHAGNTIIWRNVDFSKVKKLLTDYRFHQRLSVFDDINSLINWIEKITQDGKLENWNIVLAGKVSDKNSVWNSPGGAINKVSRTKKHSMNESDNVLNIGVLSDPKDVIADVDLENQSEEVISKVKKFKSLYAREIRSLAGLDATPQLIMYMIDKDSKVQGTSKTREDLRAVEDIVGICLNIPGGRRGTDYTATVSIHMNNDIFNDEGDLEDTHED